MNFEIGKLNIIELHNLGMAPKGIKTHNFLLL